MTQQEQGPLAEGGAQTGQCTVPRAGQVQGRWNLGRAETAAKENYQTGKCYIYLSYCQYDTTFMSDETSDETCLQERIRIPSTGSNL